MSAIRWLPARLDHVISAAESGRQPCATPVGASVRHYRRLKEAGPRAPPATTIPRRLRPFQASSFSPAAATCRIAVCRLRAASCRPTASWHTSAFVWFARRILRALTWTTMFLCWTRKSRNLDGVSAAEAGGRLGATMASCEMGSRSLDQRPPCAHRYEPEKNGGEGVCQERDHWVP
jgi:hypothetical protein